MSVWIVYLSVRLFHNRLVRNTDPRFILHPMWHHIIYTLKVTLLRERKSEIQVLVLLILSVAFLLLYNDKTQRAMRLDLLEICAVLGYYATSCGNCLPTFWDVSVPYLRVKSPSRFTFSEYRSSEDAISSRKVLATGHECPGSVRTLKTCQCLFLPQSCRFIVLSPCSVNVVTCKVLTSENLCKSVQLYVWLFASNVEKFSLKAE